MKTTECMYNILKIINQMKSKKTIVMLSTLAAVCLASCDKNEEVNVNDGAVRFTAGIGRQHGVGGHGQNRHLHGGPRCNVHCRNSRKQTVRHRQGRRCLYSRHRPRNLLPDGRQLRRGLHRLLSLPGRCETRHPPRPRKPPPT